MPRPSGMHALTRSDFPLPALFMTMYVDVTFAVFGPRYGLREESVGLIEVDARWWGHARDHGCAHPTGSPIRSAVRVPSHSSTSVGRYPTRRKLSLMNLGPPPFERIRCNVGSDKPSQVESSFSVSNRLPTLIGPSHHRGPGALVFGFEGYLVITFIHMRRGEINRLQLFPQFSHLLE